MTTRPNSPLTEADVEHFLQHGWVKIPGCFSKEAADNLTSTVWARLGMSPTDKTTWDQERINMPAHNTFNAAEFAPKAWAGICDLLGGEERIGDTNRTWNDGLIVNLGTPEGEGKNITGNKLTGWHVDGDFFVHFLDSPEQGLLVIPLFTEIKAGGGGTYICPDAIKHIAKHLHDNPQGVSPRMLSRDDPPERDSEGNLRNHLRYYNDLAASFPPDAFVEASGNIGDVYLLHPLMLHSASNNMLRTPRIITNPPVSLKQPFNFDRENESEYSVVERKTLRELGVDKLSGWKITKDREQVIPERLKRQNKMKEEENRRLAELQKKANVNVAELGAQAVA